MSPPDGFVIDPIHFGTDKFISNNSVLVLEVHSYFMGNVASCGQQGMPFSFIV